MTVPTVNPFDQLRAIRKGWGPRKWRTWHDAVAMVHANERGMALTPLQHLYIAQQVEARKDVDLHEVRKRGEALR